MENENINEEIKRIKSLFTEERLYGNLINEQKLPRTSGEFDARQDSKYYFVTYDPTEKGMSNVWNFAGLGELESRTNRRLGEEEEKIDIIGGLQIAAPQKIKKAIELWTAAIDGEYFDWSEEKYLKAGVEEFKDLVSLSKAVEEFNKDRNFKTEVEDAYVSDPWFGKDDVSVLYGSFVKPLRNLPYAITKEVEESDRGPQQDAMILKTWAEYKKWVEDHVAAYKDWVNTKKTQGTPGVKGKKGKGKVGNTENPLGDPQ